MNKKLGILIYDDVQPMDFIGPWEVFSFWKNTLHAALDMYLISENGSEVRCVDDITVKAHCDFNTAPQLDYFIVPGGKGRLQQVNNEKLIAFIQQQAKTSQYILSVCTGMFLLYQAGLLDGLSVTTYWRALPEVTALKNVKIEGERVAKNKRIWMSGGISSGIDLALELIAEVAGKETAGKVQLLFEYFPSRTRYCTLEMASELPPYYGKEEKTLLPEYMRKEME